MTVILLHVSVSRGHLTMLNIKLAKQSSTNSVATFDLLLYLRAHAELTHGRTKWYGSNE